MIQALRRNTKIFLIIVIVAFVGTTFFVWGKGSITGSDPSALATVNGEEIPLDRYQRLYRAYADFYQQLYKDRFTPELAERLAISQQVLNDLIREALILQRAKAEGIGARDEELRAQIQAIRVFQVDGQFSRERYLSILNRARIDPATFEVEQRRELVRKKMEATIKEGVKVSDMELRQAWEVRRGRVRAAWAQIEVPPLMAGVRATDAELEDYLKKNPLRFQEPERRRVQYVVVNPKALAARATDAEVAAYYKEHAVEFEQPRRVRVAHILVRVPPVGGSEAEEKAKAKVADAIRRARAGEDFGKLAKAISEDTATAGAGGEIGAVARGELVPAFEQAAFALKKGEVSPEPVRTPFGYHAIKVLGVEEGGKRPLKEVAGRIREKLEADKGERAARSKAEALREALGGAGDLQAEARRRGLEPKTALVARGEPLDGVGRVPSLEEAVFGLAVGGVTPPLKTPAGYVVAKAVESLPASVPPFAAVKGKVAEAFKREKAEALALARAKELAAARGEDLLARAKKQGVPTGDTGFFSRSQPPTDRRLPAEVVRVALDLPLGQVSGPVPTSQGVFLVTVLEWQAPDPAGFEKDREELHRQVLAQKRDQVWEGWVRSLRAEAKITVSSRFSALTP